MSDADPSPDRRIRIDVLQGRASGRSWLFTPPFDAAVGRDEGADVQLPDPGVSRVHCLLVASQDELRVLDQGSRNGTLLNGKPVHLACVHAGDVLDIGSARIRVDVIASRDARSISLSETLLKATVRAPRRPCPSSFVFCERCGRTLATATASAGGASQFGRHHICAACSVDALRNAATIAGYRLFAKIGEGQSGSVYKALHEQKGIVVALKIVPLESRPSDANLERLSREIDILRALDHPGIVRLHEAGVDDRRVYIALELVDGVDLMSRVEAAGRLPPVAVASIGRQVALALAHAHARGFVHRDVKPANMLQSGEGSVKLADFGLAKSFVETGIAQITRTGGIVGTPFYMAPEQVDDSKRATPPADVYGLGATLWHLLGGAAPFAGTQTFDECFRRKLEGPPAGELSRLAPDAHPALVRAIEHALAPRPDDRFPSASAMAEALGAIAP